MSGRSFRSVFMVASCAGAALGCYLVSLRVASERAALEQIETRIVLAQRDLRVLQTEIGTRGRLAQLERWNAKVLALSAPSADQFLGGSFELARLARPERKVDFEAPVVLASAPVPERDAIAQPDTGDGGRESPQRSSNPLLHEASLKTGTREVPAQAAADMPKAAAPKSTDRPATAAKPAQKSPSDKLGLAADQSARKKPVDKTAGARAKAMTKSVRVAKADPLAPLASTPAAKTSKDAAKAQ